MSSKTSRKAKNPKQLEPIITRKKSAQKRQLTNKKQKTEKPEIPKLTKLETKSPKSKKKSICSKDAELKKAEKVTNEIIDQVEYYPNKLKRDLNNKKVVLKPKHNFKVIATANKRKLAVPKKGIQPDLKTLHCTVSELSMQEMVRMMEETRSLSDEDFMEILTCPSPVWWEDPPDQSYYEDSVYTRSPEPQLIKTPEEQITTISPEPPPKKKTKQTNKQKSKVTKKNKNPVFVKQIKQNIEEMVNRKDEKFVKKQRKLENILGNIKNKTQIKNDDLKENVKKRKLSESTEGDISDLSFNEEILKNIETMDIPIEKTNENQTVDIKEDIQKEMKKELIDKTPQIIKPFKDELSIKSSNIDTEKRISSVIDGFINVDSNDNNSLNLNNDSNSSEDFSIEQDNMKRLKEKIKSNISKSSDNVGIPYKKIINDLTEYITVYKIIPEKTKAELNDENIAKSTENNDKPKLDTVRGKLDEFFKHCKSNKRLKKSDSPVPAIPLTDVKKETTGNETVTTDNEKENAIKAELEGKNLLKCDQCVEKTVNGKTVLSCEKCELGTILPCDLCNFLAESEEIYKKHVSTCKEIERISWSNNLVANQT